MSSNNSKVRILLSVELLETIYSLVNQSEVPEQLLPIYNHQAEINKTVGTALFKLNKGLQVATYSTVELTLEQKVNRGIATEEESNEYYEQLMNSI